MEIYAYHSVISSGMTMPISDGVRVVIFLGILGDSAISDIVLQLKSHQYKVFKVLKSSYT